MLRGNHFWYVVLPESIRHLDFEEQHLDDATAIATLSCPTCNVETQRVEIDLEVESDFQPRCEHIALYIKTAEGNTLDPATLRRLREKEEQDAKRE